MNNQRLQIASLLAKNLISANGTPYLSVDWITKNILKSIGYCPCCYNDNNIHQDPDTWSPYCDCGWKGSMVDLITENEAKSGKRTKTIDKMLNENI